MGKENVRRWLLKLWIYDEVSIDIEQVIDLDDRALGITRFSGLSHDGPRVDWLWCSATGRRTGTSPTSPKRPRRLAYCSSGRRVDPTGPGWDATLGALADLRTADGRSFRVTPIDQPAGVTMPDEFEPTKLARRTLTIVAVLAVVGLILLLAPGLGEVRHLLTEAQPEWVALAVAFEALSCVSYVLLFRPIFCHMMPWRTSWEIGLSELAAGSIVPASGAGGLALGAWILRQGGMPAERIARRSVAFFILKSSVNFVAVAVLGTVMALGLVGPDLSPWLTAVPAVGALLGNRRGAPGAAARCRGPRPGRRRPHAQGDVARAQGAGGGHGRGGADRALAQSARDRRLGRLLGVGQRSSLGGVPRLRLLAPDHGDPDGLPDRAARRAAAAARRPRRIDGGLIGTLIVYGTPAATTAAVLIYRVILFWLPLLVGAVAFISLRRALNRPDRPELCVVPAAT